jgi:hypothetical protein
MTTITSSWRRRGDRWFGTTRRAASAAGAPEDSEDDGGLEELAEAAAEQEFSEEELAALDTMFEVCGFFGGYGYVYMYVCSETGSTRNGSTHIP